MPHIYKITNPGGRIYIGSAVNIRRRFQIYRTLKCGSQTRLYASFIKYGVENHIFEIVAECTKEEMYRLEAKHGHAFDVLGKNGLNCQLPKADNMPCFSDDTRLKMSIAKKGKRSPKKGIKVCAEEAGRLKQIRQTSTGNNKIVVNLDTGIFYDNAVDACKTTLLNPGSFVNMLNPRHRHKNKTSFIYA